MDFNRVWKIYNEWIYGLSEIAISRIFDKKVNYPPYLIDIVTIRLGTANPKPRMI